MARLSASASSSPTLLPLDLLVPGMGHGRLQGNSKLSVKQTEQTAQDEPPLSAELGLILCTSGIKPSGHLHGLLPSSRLGADWSEEGLLGHFHLAVTWPRPSCARLALTSPPPETGKIWRLFVLTK